jgi:6-hydroxycyclohex-1-ene-1-carbonyl-CoA dehydrogenase
VGGFGIQVAAAMGATVVAIDVNRARLEQIAAHGAALTIDTMAMDVKALRKQVKAFAESRGIPTWRTKVFETSGTPTGQSTAFALLGHGGYLSVVGYTPQTVELRFSNLMAFDATAQGNWGCLPEHYPAIVDLVLQGRIALAPFVERRPMAGINDVFAELHAGGVTRRFILIPEGRS